MRETELGSVLLEGAGGRKAMFSCPTPKGREDLSYVNSRAQTERYKVKNEKIVEYNKRRQRNTKDTNYIF